MNILISGASADLAEEVIPTQLRRGHSLGLHCGGRVGKLDDYKDSSKALIIERFIRNESDCDAVIDDYLEWSGGIDCLIILLGGVIHTDAWWELGENDYLEEYRLNAIYPMIMARTASEKMKKRGGSIIFVSTASARHGGGSKSLGYGMAKAGLECGMKRLAKDLARYDVRINAIAPGYMDTSLQLRTKGMPATQNIDRLSTIPLGRAGTKGEFADLVDYLINSRAGFMTGQVLTLDGGDFI